MATASGSLPQTLTEQQRRALLQPISPPGLSTVLTALLLLAIFAWSWSGTEISVEKLLRGVPLTIEFFGRLWPPDNSYWLKMLEPIAATLQMAILGTALSVVLGSPLAMLAARNTTPSLPVYQGIRFLLNVIRAVPSLVWAIIFVASLGFGPFAGVISLGVAGVGTVGKLYAEAIEAINPRPVEAIRATGSGELQVFSFAVLPQALPLMVSYTLLDFEANVRSATILGIVGAGGIGFEIQASFSQFQFHQVFTILLEIIVMVTLIDRLSAYVRARLL
jgi:phosphonate transport system permease protein